MQLAQMIIPRYSRTGAYAKEKHESKNQCQTMSLCMIFHCSGVINPRLYSIPASNSAEKPCPKHGFAICTFVGAAENAA